MRRKRWPRDCSVHPQCPHGDEDGGGQAFREDRWIGQPSDRHHDAFVVYVVSMFWEILYPLRSDRRQRKP